MRTPKPPESYAYVQCGSPIAGSSLTNTGLRRPSPDSAALKLQDRKMTGKKNLRGGDCRTGKWRTTKFQGVEIAGQENDGQKCRAVMLSVIFQSCIFLSCIFSRPPPRFHPWALQTCNVLELADVVFLGVEASVCQYTIACSVLTNGRHPMGRFHPWSWL